MLPKLFYLTMALLYLSLKVCAQPLEQAILPEQDSEHRQIANKPLFSERFETNADILLSDSARRLNQLSWRDLFNGFSYYPPDLREKFSTNSPFEMFNFNTVEGFNVNLGITYQTLNRTDKILTSSTYFRYGFSNERFNLTSSLSWNMSPVRKNLFEIEGGRYVKQFNNENPIHSFVNSYYSLAYRDNYMKLYGSNFGHLKYEYEIVNGVYLQAGVKYEDREPLKNNTNFAFLIEDREAGVGYTSNDPVEFANQEDPFTRHQALTIDATLRILFREQYISILDTNIPMGSEYPNITLNYRRGIKAFGSDVDYNFASINIGQDLDYGFYGVSSWDVNAGTFFNVRDLNFIDYQHFNGNKTIFISYPEPLTEDRTPLDRFQLLDYYLFSTRHSFWTVHMQHNFKGFIMEKIPFMNTTNIQSVIGVNFLQTSDDVVHFEFSTGLKNIFDIFRIDFVTGYNSEEKLKGAVRLSLELNELIGTPNH